jgi:tetratricopeptide (TPR) repeat protein
MIVICVAYIGLLQTVFKEAWSPTTSELKDSNGSELLGVATSPALTRASVLARIRGVPIKSGDEVGPRPERRSKRRSVLRRDAHSETAAERNHGVDEVAILESTLLHIMAGGSQGAQREREVSKVYSALADIHSNRGQYFVALGAMDKAFRAANNTADVKAIGQAHIAFARLEAQHFRYFAAHSRIRDALAFGEAFHEATFAEALSAAGWSSLMQEDAPTSENWLVAALGRAGFSLQAPQVVTCEPLRDGLDASRSIALSGLCMIRATDRNSLVTTSSAWPAHELCGCAARFIVEGGEPAARRAVGLAWLSAGFERSGLQEQRQALAEERSSAARRSSCVLHIGTRSSNRNWTELTQCAHSAIQLGLAEFVVGDRALGIGFVDQLAAGIVAAAERAAESGDKSAALDIEEEGAEWLVRFARLLLRGRLVWAQRPGYDVFAAVLLSRATPLLLRSGAAAAATRQEPRLADHAAELRTCLEGIPLRGWQEVLGSIEHAIAAFSSPSAGPSRNFNWPDAEVVTLHRLLAAVQHRVGKVDDAIGTLRQAVEGHVPGVLQGVGVIEAFLFATIDLASLQTSSAGDSRQMWRQVIETFRKARRVARREGLGATHPAVHSLEVSYRNALRLAHIRGVFDSCVDGRDLLFHAAWCPA